MRFRMMICILERLGLHLGTTIEFPCREGVTEGGDIRGMMVAINAIAWGYYR